MSICVHTCARACASACAVTSASKCASTSKRTWLRRRGDTCQLHSIARTQCASCARPPLLCKGLGSYSTVTQSRSRVSWCGARKKPSPTHTKRSACRMHGPRSEELCALASTRLPVDASPPRKNDECASHKSRRSSRCLDRWACCFAALQ